MSGRPAPRILVVDDEEDLLRALAFALEREGYDVRTASTARAALELAAAAPPPDLVLLDVMLPDRSGTDVARALRASAATRSVPIVMLTARGEEIDRVVGFEVGADDYVVKPFSVRELMLRVRAILRRTGADEAPDAAVELGDLRVDPAAHRAWVDGEEVVLTALEFRLLRTFLERRGRVQTREALLEDVWEMAGDVTTRTVDTHVKRLRRKLGAAGAYIETLRGVGYRMRDAPP